MSKDKLPALTQLLQQMLEDDETLSARNVARRSSGDFKHASDITRHAARRDRLEEYQIRQSTLRGLAIRLDKESKPRLQARLAAAEKEIATLKAQRDLLVVGLRSTIHAVGEVGGMRSWRRFYEGYSAAFQTMVELGAVPRTVIQLDDERSPGGREPEERT